MNREEFISKLVAIYKLRYQPSEVEIEEFKLLLEMMPDRPALITNPTPPPPPFVPDERKWPPISVVYGVQIPSSVAYGSPYPNDVTYTSTSTDDTLQGNKQKRKR